MEEEKEILRNYIFQRGLRNTEQRERVLEVFLSNESHFSVDELYYKVKQLYPDISHSTVFRSMKVIYEAGLADKLRIKDGIVRYEHRYKHKNHGHMVCLQCGKIIEFDNDVVNLLQKKAAEQAKFEPQGYKTKIVGLCSDCQ